MIKEHIIWVEKYRPKKIIDTVLPASLRPIFQGYVDSGLIPNMSLGGGPGIGKTTIAKALCDELDADSMVINCSEDGNIDKIRTDIRDFASTVSITGGRKVIILDEADGLTPLAQKALRNFMEEFARNCSFIMTCNVTNQIIKPLYSRCPLIEFKMTKEDKVEMAKSMHKVIAGILAKEKIPFDNKTLVKLIMKYFPDFRETIGQIQKYSVTGKIDDGILANLDGLPVKGLVQAMAKKNFGEVRKWVAANLDNEPQRIFRQMFDVMYDLFEPAFIPQLVLIMGDYMDQASRSLDPEITLLAFVTRVMADDDFKVKDA